MPIEDIELTHDLPAAYVTGEVIACGVSNGTKSVKYFKGTSQLVNSADDVMFKQRSLDKAFTKHRADFGNYTDGSKASVVKFRQDISELINTRIQKAGTWKGVKGTHIYNKATRQWCVINADRSFNTAFKLSVEQFEYLIKIRTKKINPRCYSPPSVKISVA